MKHNLRDEKGRYSNAPERTDWTAIIVTWFAVAAFVSWGVGFLISLI